MIELSVGHEYGGVGSILFLANVQQFDSRTFSGQTLEGELDSGKALEFDLKPETFLHSRPLLGLPSGIRCRLKLFHLTPQHPAVLRSISCGGIGPASSSPGTIRLRLRNAFENEVSVFPFAPIRHVEIVFLRYGYVSPRLSATFLRSASMLRTSASPILVRPWIRASFRTSFAARVTSA